MLHLPKLVRNLAASTLGTRLGTAAGVLAGLLCVAMGLSMPTRVSSHFVAPLQPILHQPIRFQTTMVTEEVKRKVFPYSIVPGGAEDVHHAKIAMSDPAVKDHYAGIDFAQLKQVKLESNLSGYVSYRWGDKIYWTKKKVTLRKGETVFTDGTHLVRGRCLNCYSALPMAPVRPIEPTEKLMDTPQEIPTTAYRFEQLPLLAPVIPIPPGELTPSVPVLPAGVTPVLGAPHRGGWFFPLIPIIPPIHRHHGPGGSSPILVPPPLPPPAVVPEPRYYGLLGAAMLGMLAAARLRRKSRLLP